MKIKDLERFENKMRTVRGWKRGELCAQLGVSQAKWRRKIDGDSEQVVKDDLTMSLAMAALDAGLNPYGNI